MTDLYLLMIITVGWAALGGRIIPRENGPFNLIKAAREHTFMVSGLATLVLLWLTRPLWLGRVHPIGEMLGFVVVGFLGWRLGGVYLKGALDCPFCSALIAGAVGAALCWFVPQYAVLLVLVGAVGYSYGLLGLMGIV